MSEDVPLLNIAQTTRNDNHNATPIENQKRCGSVTILNCFMCVSIILQILLVLTIMTALFSIHLGDVGNIIRKTSNIIDRAEPMIDQSIETAEELFPFINNALPVLNKGLPILSELLPVLEENMPLLNNATYIIDVFRDDVSQIEDVLDQMQVEMTLFERIARLIEPCVKRKCF